MLSRIRTVFRRFGISSRKFERLLKQYGTVTRNLGCVPTFPITAVTLKRHPKIIRELCGQGLEFAVHGYIHTDYGVPPLEEQVAHFSKAVDTFNECGVPFTGFRAPFLRINGSTPRAISKIGFPYDSSWAVHWDVINKYEYPEDSWHEYERLLDFYQSRKAQDYVVLPRSIDGYTEIPVSMPDDEVVVERLGITEAGKISEIWQKILQRTYDNGELFTIQLHPERISQCEGALVDVIQQTKVSNPPVWVATLGEIAGWWKEKSTFKFDIKDGSDGRFRVKADCSERATVLLKNGKVDVPAGEWFDGYQSVAAREFVVESVTRPTIGIGRDASPAAVRFLQSEGYVVEPGDQPDKYGIYFGDLTRFDEAGEKLLSQEIERSNAPLLRYWRWPDQARSALSVTGDIDSMTLIDFVLRIIENWRNRSR